MAILAVTLTTFEGTQAAPNQDAPSADSRSDAGDSMNTHNFGEPNAVQMLPRRLPEERDVFSPRRALGVEPGQTSPPDGSWHALGTGMILIQTFPGAVFALTVYEGQLVAAGSFTQAGGVSANRIARWDGNAWYPLGSGLNGVVRALTVYNGDLIAGGGFTQAGGTSANRIARWDGDAWHALGDGISGPDLNSEVNALQAYKGHLIAGGYFTVAGGTSVNAIAQWDGGAWSPLGSGVKWGGGSGTVAALTLHNNELVATGLFQTAGSVSASNVARWNGGSWSRFGGGQPDWVNAAAVHNGQLVVGGQSFSGAVAVWTGSVWQPILGGDATVFSLLSYGGELYAGGGTGFLDERFWIARWDGEAWYGLNSGANNSIWALGTSCGELIVGGFLDEVYNGPGDVLSTPGIAAWVVPQPFSVKIVGDVDGSENITSTDIIALVNFTFKNGSSPLPCEGAGDVNCDGVVNSTDIIGLVNFTFKSGPQPCDVCALINTNVWVCP